MGVFELGDKVRVDIPDTADPDFAEYHGKEGVVVSVMDDDAGASTGDERDSVLYRVEFDGEERHDFRWRDLRPRT